MIDNFEPQLNHKTVQVTRGLFLTLRKENGISAESSFQRILDIAPNYPFNRKEPSEGAF